MSLTISGWNLLRDKQKCFSQHKRGKPENLSPFIENNSKPQLCATSLDPCLAKENGSTSVEENPAALNLIMENYSSSSDTSESDTAGLSNTDKLAVSKECSTVAENKLRISKDKEFSHERELKQINLKIEYQGERSCQVFDRREASCATESKNLSLPSVDPITDGVKGGLVADGTAQQDTLSICELDCLNGVRVKQDHLWVPKKKGISFDLDVESTSRHNPLDISRGEENIPIPLAGDVVGNLSPEFYYTSKCVIYQNAPVTFSLAKVPEDECCSSCFGDCLNSPIACACSKETGGEYAYNADGCLHDWFLRKAIKEKIRWDVYPRDYYCPSMSSCPIERLKYVRKIESCKGHLLRKFVKECWRKCGCDKRCGNRVVQRGISRRLEVFWAPHGKGWGVRTLENLPAGAFVCEYVGEILTHEELEGRKMSKSGYLKQPFPLLLDADLCSDHVLKNGEPLCLDSTHYGNIARFINHRCYDANVLDIPILIESTDRHYYHVAYFTNRVVEVREELTWDYEIDFDDKHSLKAFQCRCGSRFCRGRDYKLSEIS
ncbi:hypothetical protein O6H91_05G056600 [Diphasiastrum complanatum]|uniref:Uncharacterized protein n=1 Tax=Diphasiastrum complanatum TaxID=34168 RepID=A0ACC2DNL4_DIPCM|nr:hypothetical protein O6H91_05G056600 [Diphasiastrum complanatum]